MKILARNKNALYNYEVLEKLNSGIELKGWEVKSIKAGNISLKESYITFFDSQPKLVKAFVTKWKGGGKDFEMNETRERLLLLNKAEINKLRKSMSEKSLTIVPLNIYLSKNIVKLEIALVRGKKKYDKRNVIKERDQKRQIELDLKNILKK